MAWHSGKPADNDFLSASVQHIRENFAELEPLQPHVAALLGSRIVEHNLNTSNPTNGHYVRFENGWQICFGRLLSSPASQHWNYLNNGADTTGIERQWTPPAAFSAASATHQDVMLDLGWGFTGPFRLRTSYAYVTPTPIAGTRSIIVRFTESIPNLDFSQGFAVSIFAMGRWK